MRATTKSKHNKGRELVAGVSQRSTQETPAVGKRGIKRPSPELGELIRLVNLVPEGDALSHIGTEQATASGSEDRSIETFNLEEWLQDLNEELRDYLRQRCEGFDDPVARFFTAVSSYERVVNAREALYAFIDRQTKPSPLIRFLIDNEPAFALPGGSYVRVVTSTDRRGKRTRKAEVRLSAIAKALDGAEVDYIRRCAVCGKVFFAGRDKQPCCSKKCAKSLRQSRWRTKRSQGYYQGAELSNKEKDEAKKKRASKAPKR